MPKPSPIDYISVQEYLAREEKSPIKHEYVDGRMFAMSGVRKNHNVTTLNIGSILRSHLRGSGCRAYVAEVKVYVKATNSFYYPDVMVACDQFDGKDVFVESPVLVVEILSRSTEKIDRREKAYAYKQIPSLREYLIVHQRRRRAELHRRNAEGGWDIIEFSPGTQVRLESLPGEPLSVPIEDIYEETDVPEGGSLVREEASVYLDDEPEDW